MASLVVEALYDDVGAPRLSRQQLAQVGLRGADAAGHLLYVSIRNDIAQ